MKNEFAGLPVHFDFERNDWVDNNEMQSYTKSQIQERKQQLVSDLKEFDYGVKILRNDFSLVEVLQYFLKVV